jgi:endonuclease/exonuclease/phosphatase family metal-dependent hydrolase
MLALAWPNFTRSEVISLTTWNLEWLTNNPVENISESKRSREDLTKLAEHIDFIQPDILAFQEVNNISAIKSIINNKYKIYLSDRNKIINSKLQFEDINQFTGFAIAPKWQVTDPADLPLSPGHKLRFASYVIIHLDGKHAIHLLSVHLKAGCRGKYKNSRSCTMLKKQGEKLNEWIIDRQAQGQSFIILGDFNHNLAYSGDWLWQVLTKKTNSPIKENILLATKGTESECLVRSKQSPKRTYQYHNLIDHIVVSGDLMFAQPKQYVFPVEQVVNYHLSDHCPLTIQVNN